MFYFNGKPTRIFHLVRAYQVDVHFNLYKCWLYVPAGCTIGALTLLCLLPIKYRPVSAD
jgi:hypothetical protein